MSDHAVSLVTPYAVRDGQWVGVLAGRDSAAVAGLDYAGSVRADGWARLPMVRMTKVGLEPGPHSLDEMIEATGDGIFMEHNRSLSIDDRRFKFQFGCEIGYEVRNGKLGRMVRNPTYTGIGPQFWRSEVDGPAADSEVARLVAGVDRGVLVTDHWYTRVLDPRTLVMTGLTRNGVWLIEGGQIVRPVWNMRLTQSYPEALGPGAVLGIGRHGVRLASRYEDSSTVVPALRVASSNFTAAHPANGANPASRVAAGE